MKIQRVRSKCRPYYRRSSVRSEMYANQPLSAHRYRQSSFLKSKPLSQFHSKMFAWIGLGKANLEQTKLKVRLVFLAKIAVLTRLSKSPFQYYFSLSLVLLLATFLDHCRASPGFVQRRRLVASLGSDMILIVSSRKYTMNNIY